MDCFAAGFGFCFGACATSGTASNDTTGHKTIERIEPPGAIVPRRGAD
jgi:hypothetical protein